MWLFQVQGSRVTGKNKVPLLLVSKDSAPNKTFFFQTGFLCVALALDQTGSNSLRFSCLCLPNAGINGVCHHAQLLITLNKVENKPVWLTQRRFYFLCFTACSQKNVNLVTILALFTVIESSFYIWIYIINQH